jgi:signal transduction histidine kinase
MGSVVSASVPDNQVDETLSAKELNETAYIKFQQGDYQASYGLSAKALVKAKAEKNRKEKARAFSNIASNLRYFGEAEKALEFYSQSLNESTEIDDYEGINRALNNLASVYSDIGDRNEEKKFRQRQLETSFLTDDITDQIIAYIGLAQHQLYLKQISSATDYLNKARTALIEKADPFLEIYVLLTESDISAAKDDLENAISLNEQAYQLAKENKYQGLELSSKTNIVEYYLKQNKLALAIEEAEKLLIQSKAIRLQTKTLQLHNILNQAYESLADYKNALYHQRQANQVEQQLSGQKVRFLGEITKIDRQVLQQQEKLVELEKDQQIMALKLKQQKQNQFIWIVLAILIFGISFFLYYRHTSRKEILRQRKLNQRLEELDKVKDRVLTNTSHELRTPLNGIIGLSDVIIKDEDNKFSESTLNCLKLIRSSGEQLALVINDILELSKLKNSSLTIVKSKFDLQELIRDVIAVCQPNISGKDISIENRNDGEKTLVFLDRGRVQQVLFNIVGNAIKFTDKGKIEIHCEMVADQLKISVLDTGKGIPAENLERIFEGFEQVDAGNSREQPGTGLGLAITKGIVEAMGGIIELTSKLGIGTQVYIVLPQ